MRKPEMIYLNVNEYQNKLLKTPNQNIPEDQNHLTACLSLVGQLCAKKTVKVTTIQPARLGFQVEENAQLAGLEGSV